MRSSPSPKIGVNWVIKMGTLNHLTPYWTKVESCEKDLNIPECFVQCCRWRISVVGCDGPCMSQAHLFLVPVHPCRSLNPDHWRSPIWKQQCTPVDILLLTLHLTINLPLPFLFYTIHFSELFVIYVFIYLLTSYLFDDIIYLISWYTSTLSTFFHLQVKKCTLSYFIFQLQLYHTHTHTYDSFIFMSLIKLIVFLYNLISSSLLPRLQFSATRCSNILGV